MKFKVVKGFTGYSIRFHCPNCNSGLTAKVREAGQSDSCPDCNAKFVVPGIELKTKLESEKASKAAAAETYKREKAEAKAIEKDQRRQDKELKKAAAAEEAEAAAAEDAARDARYRALERPIDEATTATCPYCSSTQGFVITSKPSNAGCVVMIVLLIFFFPLFWIGVFIRESTTKCKACGMVIATH